jgi:hypothetical protein
LDTNTLTTLPATPTDSAHNVLLQWSAPSQYKHDRSSRWYLIAGIVTIAFTAFVAVWGIRRKGLPLWTPPAVQPSTAEGGRT